MRDLAAAAGILAVLAGGYLAFQSRDTITDFVGWNNSDSSSSTQTVTAQNTGMVIEKNGKKIIMGKNGITVINSNGDTTQVNGGVVTHNGERITGDTNHNSNTITTVVRNGKTIKVSTTVNGKTTTKEYQY